LPHCGVCRRQLYGCWDKKEGWSTTGVSDIEYRLHAAPMLQGLALGRGRERKREMRTCWTVRRCVRLCVRQLFKQQQTNAASRWLAELAQGVELGRPNRSRLALQHMAVEDALSSEIRGAYSTLCSWTARLSSMLLASPVYVVFSRLHAHDKS
jgi:hypothetical protein